MSTAVDCSLSGRPAPGRRPVAHVARELGISRQCAHEWKRRHDAEGEAGPRDRSSRPKTSPTRTPLAVELQIAIQRRRHKTRVGYDFVHSAVDDHSRLAHSEVLPDERKETCIAFWSRAHAFFTAHNITDERVLTDNGNPYRSQLWRDLLTT